MKKESIIPEIADFGTYVDKWIKEDETGVARIILREGHEKFVSIAIEKLNEMSLKDNQWNSDLPIFFIQQTIDVLKLRSERIRQKIGDLTPNNYQKLSPEQLQKAKERMEGLLQTVEENIPKFHMVLLERNFAAHNKLLNQQSNELSNEEPSFENALAIFHNPKLAKTTPLGKFYHFLCLHRKQGVKDLAGRGLMCLMYSEFIRRLNQNEISEAESHVNALLAGEFYRDPQCPQSLKSSYEEAVLNFLTTYIERKLKNAKEQNLQSPWELSWSESSARLEYQGQFFKVPNIIFIIKKKIEGFKSKDKDEVASERKQILFEIHQLLEQQNAPKNGFLHEVKEFFKHHFVGSSNEEASSTHFNFGEIVINPYQCSSW